MPIIKRIECVYGEELAEYLRQKYAKQAIDRLYEAYENDERAIAEQEGFPDLPDWFEQRNRVVLDEKADRQVDEDLEEAMAGR